jgi:lipopolysaccharide export LptBFGC system permease protein LptF
MTTGTSPVAGPHRIKQGKASLVGGVAVGVAVLVLWTAVAHELAADSVPTIIVGVLVAAGIATWIRVADL